MHETGKDLDPGFDPKKAVEYLLERIAKSPYNFI